MNSPFLLTLWVELYAASRAASAINARPVLSETLKRVSENEWEYSTHNRNDVVSLRETINEQMAEYDIVEYQIEIH